MGVGHAAGRPDAATSRRFVPSAWPVSSAGSTESSGLTRTHTCTSMSHFAAETASGAPEGAEWDPGQAVLALGPGQFRASPCTPSCIKLRLGARGSAAWASIMMIGGALLARPISRAPPRPQADVDRPSSGFCSAASPAGRNRRDVRRRSPLGLGRDSASR